MKDVEIPRPTELTGPEQQLVSKIGFDLDRAKDNEEILTSCDLAHDLMTSLVARDGIPAARWNFFTQPEHNTGSKSRLEIIQRNGNPGDEAFRHVHFLQFHLPYLLNGPQLPRETIDGFCKIVNDDVGTSGMVLEALRKFARAQVRKHGLAKSNSGAFYLLALECGESFHADAIRRAAQSAAKS